jgi:hypothetical protein
MRICGLCGEDAKDTRHAMCARSDDPEARGWRPVCEACWQRLLSLARERGVRPVVRQ